MIQTTITHLSQRLRCLREGHLYVVNAVMSLKFCARCPKCEPDDEF